MNKDIYNKNTVDNISLKENSEFLNNPEYMKIAELFKNIKMDSVKGIEINNIFSLSLENLKTQKKLKKLKNTLV